MTHTHTHTHNSTYKYDIPYYALKYDDIYTQLRNRFFQRTIYHKYTKKFFIILRNIQIIDLKLRIFGQERGIKRLQQPFPVSE